MEGEIAAIILINVIIHAIFGVACLAIANAKGRNKVGWFFLGFFFGWIPIVIVAVLPNLNEQRSKERQQDRTNRRLREQLRQERMKSESFRQHTQARLDVHDQTLGIDTRAVHTPMLTDQGAQSFEQLPSPTQSIADWYYEANGESIGPVKFDELWMMFNSESAMPPQTLVWAEHLGDWTEADMVDGLVTGGYRPDSPNEPTGLT